MPLKDPSAAAIASPIGGQSTGVRLIGNELCNCVSNGLQITQNATACYPKIIEIAYNDIYITAELYTNGGSTVCAENALDFKGGSHAHVHHNAMRCNGRGDAGYAINLHKLANNYMVETNNMFDIGHGSVVSAYREPTGFARSPTAKIFAAVQTKAGQPRDWPT